jgi:hypothetical protein
MGFKILKQLGIYLKTRQFGSISVHNKNNNYKVATAILLVPSSSLSSSFPQKIKVFDDNKLIILIKCGCG